MKTLIQKRDSNQDEFQNKEISTIIRNQIDLITLIRCLRCSSRIRWWGHGGRTTPIIRTLMNSCDNSTGLLRPCCLIHCTTCVTVVSSSSPNAEYAATNDNKQRDSKTNISQFTLVLSSSGCFWKREQCSDRNRSLIQT